jgi:hypothetical protein
VCNSRWKALALGIMQLKMCTEHEFFIGFLSYINQISYSASTLKSAGSQKSGLADIKKPRLARF